MILRTRCPSCDAVYRMQSPLPAEGKKYRCTCGTVITISYPPEVRAELAKRGVGPADKSAQPAVPAAAPAPPSAAPTPPKAASPSPAHAAPKPAPAARKAAPPPARPATPPPAARKAAQPATPAAPRGAGLTPPPVIPPLDASIRSRRDELDESPTIRRAPMPSSGVSPAGLTEPTYSPAPMPERRPNQRPVTAPAAERAATAPPPPPRATPPPPLVAPTPAKAEAKVEPKAEPARSEQSLRKPPAAAKKPRARRSGGFLSRLWSRRLVRWTLYLATFAFLAGAIGFFAVISHFSKGLPSVDSLAVYEPPTVTILRDSKGAFVGEFFEEQRYVSVMEDIPAVVKDAFVSAEDASFWEHSGLDFMGIARAMLKNIEQRRMAQGASTITQQVARSFLLTREKKLARKIKEAILSVRVERNFEKAHILYLYLNQIYLGHGAYGVNAASKLYFDKDVADIGLAEAAILAGLPQAPHTYSPNRNFQAAKDRQKYVLGQMVRREYITQEEADAAYEQDLVFVKKRDRNLDQAPYYVEHVRRYLVATYGHKAVYQGGLQVTLPLDMELQLEATRSVAAGVRKADKRIGYRGAIAKHETPADRQKVKRAIDRERALTLRTYHPAFELAEGEAVDPAVIPPVTEGEITRGVVAKVDAKWALVDVGSIRGVMPVKEFSWCHNVKPDVQWRYFNCRNLDDMVFEGEEIAVRVVTPSESWSKTLPKELATGEFPRLAMEQNPWPEAALMSMRVTDGAILAMVGGTDYTASEFNRSIQAKRQVGSTFKPLVYAAALDNEKHPFTPSTILVDAPIVEELSGKDGELWKPGNSGGEYLGDTTMRRGLVLSRNIVTLKILRRIGVKYTLEYMQRFGFKTPLEENLAMGLGASALTMHEMVRAYSVFPTLGDRREPYFISEVKDRHGNVLEAREAGELTEDVMTEETAFLMVNLMHDVVRSGTAFAATKLGVPLAGKTGTTNGFRDAWFIGYTPQLITATWVGLDDFKSMGKGQYGGEVALPIWMDYMEDALKVYPEVEYEKPKGIKFHKVDSKSGLLAHEGDPAVSVAYKKGTEPTTYAPKAGQVDAADFLSGEF